MFDIPYLLYMGMSQIHGPDTENWQCDSMYCDNYTNFVYMKRCLGKKVNVSVQLASDYFMFSGHNSLQSKKQTHKCWWQSCVVCVIIITLTFIWLKLNYSTGQSGHIPHITQPMSQAEDERSSLIPGLGQSRGLLEFCFVDVPYAEKTPCCCERVLSSQADRNIEHTKEC